MGNHSNGDSKSWGIIVMGIQNHGESKSWGIKIMGIQNHGVSLSVIVCYFGDSIGWGFKICYLVVERGTVQ